jgi:chromosome segregation ATPase
MTDQPAYVTREEFERRMGELRSEIEGEKRVTRHVLEQARLNGDDLATMTAQISHLADDMVLVKTTLNSHGNRLNILTQDVREIRMEVGQMRTEMGHMRTEIGQMHTEIGQMRTEMGQMHTEIGQMRTEMGQMHTEMGEVRAKLDKLDVLAQDVAAIRTALVRRDPPAE